MLVTVAGLFLPAGMQGHRGAQVSAAPQGRTRYVIIAVHGRTKEPESVRCRICGNQRTMLC